MPANVILSEDYIVPFRRYEILPAVSICVETAGYMIELMLAGKAAHANNYYSGNYKGYH
jgi:hypothetical protein